MATMRGDGRRPKGGLVMALAAAALIATTANAALRPGSIVSAPPTAQKQGPVRHAWSAVQVRELIRLVEESRRHGLDPDDYGLAALRSELDQSAAFYRADGSPQLDAVAHASALALARAYRRQASLDEAGLATALRTNSLRAWIGAPAPAERS